MPGGRGPKHGGYREPAKPAAVSGPGAMSQRTDSAATQPVRVAAGGGYGDRAASVAQQQSAPLAAGGGAPVASPSGLAAGSSPPQLPSPFGPSNRPNEPVTAGAALGPGAGAPNPREDTLAALQALWPLMPLPEIQDMIAQAQREVGR